MSDGFTLTAGSRAFGDGAHPSTQAMLTALEALRDIRGIARVLDMGCGSGILSLKAAWQWHAQVIAADIAVESVQATRQNATDNGLEALIQAVQSDGCHHLIIEQSAPYQLIMANLLAEPLLAMAHDFARLAEPDEGLLLLSGLLRWQADTIREAYEALGFGLLQRYVAGEWTALLMQRETA